MRNIFLSVVVTLLVGVVMLGCGENNSNKLVMATEATFPPYEYYENGKIVGLDVDIISEVAKDMGKELVIEDMLFDSVIPAIMTHKADIGASGISVTEDRKLKVDFSTPYIESNQLIIIPKTSTIKGAKDLKGKRIGVQHGTTGDIYVTQNIQEPERFANGALATAALVAGKLDAIVLDAEPSKAHVSKQPTLMLLTEPLMKDSYAFAVRKGNQELLNQINATLERLEKSGELAKLKAKYIK